eukprot:CAMPEP_0180505512 /NCGR_PEP_ID=MMETSP1036_2-20121128/47411_1 /TAXON_ID=632150 /ORGANISM="Azadinium spinosum, Strain 3D9" /LENGTH=87 /DNA_ID=CAMNT_0022515223 /DNA_START=90 /DNA_END=349 /DNA_ORIENTATION=-
MATTEQRNIVSRKRVSCFKDLAMSVSLSITALSLAKQRHIQELHQEMQRLRRPLRCLLCLLLPPKRGEPSSGSSSKATGSSTGAPKP